MGIDTNIYLGPYVEVLVELHMVKNDRCKGETICSDTDPEASGYCQQCGIKLCERYSFDKEEKPKNVDTYTLFNDYLCTNDGMCYPPEVEIDGKKFRRRCYMPNVKRNWPRDVYFFDDEVEISPLDVDDIKNDKDWFTSAFAKEIKVLEDRYDNVSICWGFVRWQS